MSSSEDPLIFSMLRRLLEKGEIVTTFMTLHCDGYDMTISNFKVETDVSMHDVNTYRGPERIVTGVTKTVVLEGTIDGPLGPDEEVEERLPYDHFENMRLRKFTDRWALI